MEEENQVFGKNAEAVDSNINLESEDFNFYHQNKEEAKKNINSSSKDLSDFIDSLIQDIPEPSQEDVNSGIEKILERTHPTEVKSETNKKKKVTFKVLFIAALLSVLSFSCLYVVGSSHNISIENGFVTFAKDTIQVVFFGEEEEEYISVDALLKDLEAHGYGDILFPQEFVANYDVYKVSVPEYSEDVLDQVLFEISSENSMYSFAIFEYNQDEKYFNYDKIKDAQSIKTENTRVYLFEYDLENLALEFTYGKYHFYIHSLDATYSDMEKLAKTIK